MQIVRHHSVTALKDSNACILDDRENFHANIRVPLLQQVSSHVRKRVIEDSRVLAGKNKIEISHGFIIAGKTPYFNIEQNIADNMEEL